jgi:uridine kinase
MSYLIGVAGPSGAGKSELSRRLAAVLAAPIIPQDAYYHDLGHLTMEERTACNFDIPDSIDHGLLARDLRRLEAGGDAAIPVYDFARYTRTGETEHIPASEFVIVEGLFALYWEEIRGLLCTRVFVELDDRVCFDRRLERDVRERGRTPDSVRRQYESTVRPMARQYGLPTRAHADVVVGGADLLERSVARVLAHLERVGIAEETARGTSL